jgi:hypothetical protein
MFLSRYIHAGDKIKKRQDDSGNFHKRIFFALGFHSKNKTLVSNNITPKNLILQFQLLVAESGVAPVLRTAVAHARCSPYKDIEVIAGCFTLEFN